jgi:hypothetical protein
MSIKYGNTGLHDGTDDSKIAAFDVSGVTTGTTRTITVPDASGTMALQGPAFRAYATGVTSVTSSYVKIALAGEDFDTDGAFDSATNSRFQPAVAGYYQLSGKIQYGSNSYSVRASIYKNGAVAAHGQFVTTYDSSVNTLLYLNGSTDYVELYGYSSTTQNSDTGTALTYFSGVLVRRA